MASTEYGEVTEGVSMSKESTTKNKKNASVPASGVYVHKESGQRAIVIGDPLYGNAQAQGFTRLGFVFEREARENEIVTLPQLAADERKGSEASLKGLAARLDNVEDKAAKSDEALKQKTEENRQLQDEVSDLRKKLAEVEKSEKKEAKAEKKEAKKESKQADADAKQIEDAGKAVQTDGAKDSGEDAKAKAEAKDQTTATGSTNTKVNGKEGK